jgi:chorismate mutase/prephenate dehydratase
MKIGYQGIAGSYSETIIQRYLTEEKNQSLTTELVSYDSFKEMVQALLAEEMDIGVFPVENSTTGLITRTLDLFRGQPLFMEEERYQDVCHTLWGLPGASIEKLQQVYSHPEALSQSETFFENHPHIEAVPYTDTAEAARFIHEEQDPTKGALAGPQNGELYQLIPLLKGMQSETTNTTRFFFTKYWHRSSLSIEEELEEYHKKNPERTSWLLYVETKHQPGSLATLLNVFDLFHCNLEGLDARPIKDQPFRYGFFIEVDVSHLAGDYQLLWKNLEYASEFLQIIGSFEPMHFEGDI